MTFAQSSLFSRLQPGELEFLEQISQDRRFEEGREIFKEGDAGDGIYFVREGLVEISVQVERSTRHVFSQVEPGDIFGEMAVIEDKPRSASAVARKFSTVAFIPRAEILKLVERSPVLAMALLREISHRLREFDLQYLREVVRAERLAIVGRFARSIVHDLKNPLNIIGLTAEIASASQGAAEVRQQAVASIRQQVDRISEMISEILEFTQGTSPDLVLPPMDYRQFVQQLIEELRPEAVLKAVSMSLENEPPAVPLLLNPKRLRRAFYNLVHNATDAMPMGGRIMVRFQTTPTEVVTEIEDTGPGVAPEMVGQLFQAFATYGKEHGTGLGLSICRRIIEDHRGWINARHEAGRGAIFAFGLPRPSR